MIGDEIVEIWDAYYKNGELAGKDLIRGEEIPKEYRHGVAEVFVMHKDGSILLMQRDWNKESYPRKYKNEYIVG